MNHIRFDSPLVSAQDGDAQIRVFPLGGATSYTVSLADARRRNPPVHQAFLLDEHGAKFARIDDAPVGNAA